MRGFGLVFLGVIILGLSGCGADNESDAVKASKTAGQASSGGEGKAVAPATINNMEDYAKQNAGKNNYQGTKLDKSK
jgi:hypothetical protein